MMMGPWWWVWLGCMAVFLLTPVGYGWGYRGWGPPLPTYVQRRRMAQRANAGGSADGNHTAWGWGGDFVWVIVFVGTVWALAALFWGRAWW